MKESGRIFEPLRTPTVVVAGDGASELVSQLPADDRLRVETAEEDRALALTESGVANCVVSVDGSFDFLGKVRERDTDVPLVAVTDRKDYDESMDAGVTEVVEPSTDRRGLGRRLWRYADGHRLNLSEAALTSFLRYTPDPVVVHDEEGKIVGANRRVVEKLGYSRKELLDMEVSDIEVGVEADVLKELWEDYDQNEPIVLEGRHRRKDGEEYPTEVSLGRIGDQDGGLFVAVTREISDDADRTMGRLRQEYETVFDNVRDPTFLVEAVDDRENFVFRRLNPAYEENVGIPEEEIIGKPPQQVFGKEVGSELADNYRRCLERGETLSYEETLEVPVGERVYHTKISPVASDSEPEQVVGTARDITEIKRRERELERKERRYQAFLEDPNILVGLLDTDGKVLDINQTAMGYIDAEAKDVVGEPFWDTPWWEEPEQKENLKQDIRRAVEGEYVEYEAEHGGEQCEEYVSSGILRPVTNSSGEVESVVVSSRDITNRVQRQNELERYKTYVESTLDLITHIDTDGTILYQSPSVEKVLGIEQDDWIGDAATDYIHPEDKTLVAQKLKSVSDDSETSLAEAEFRIQKGDGSYVWFESIAHDISDTETGGVVVSSRDITERKEYEKELERYQEIIQNFSDIVTLLSDDGTVVYQSPSIENILGYEKDELIDDNVFEYVHPEDKQGTFQEFAHLIEDPDNKVQDVEFRMRHKDGSYVWVEAVGADRRDTELDAIVVNTRDITERKEREQELEELNTRMQLTLKETGTGVWEWDIESDEVSWDETTERLFGYEPGEFPGTMEEFTERVHDDDLERVEQQIQNALETGEQYSIEFRICTPEGDQYWIQTRGVVEYGDDGNPLRMFGIQTDITERKKRERELERSRELLSHTERIADTGGWELDVETGEQRWTDGTRRIHGVPEEHEPTAKEGIEFYHPEDREEIREAVKNCRENGEPYDKELRLITPDDELRWVRVLGEPVKQDGEVTKLRGVIQNITERKEREKRLQEQKDELEDRKEQMEFFNSLLRHDMLNSMTVIQGNAEILLEELPEDSKSRERAGLIYSRSKDVADLANRVRSVVNRITGDDDRELSAVNLSETVEERANSLKEESEVDVTTDMPEEAHVKADSFLGDVVENLLFNAVEHNDKEEPKVEVEVESGPDDTVLRVADNGPGVSDELKEKVFRQGEKGRTSGSVGFGLYFVDSMVSEYGGEVWVEDNEPEGSVFVVELQTAKEGPEGPR